MYCGATKNPNYKTQKVVKTYRIFWSSKGHSLIIHHSRVGSLPTHTPVFQVVSIPFLMGHLVGHGSHWGSGAEPRAGYYDRKG